MKARGILGIVSIALGNILWWACTYNQETMGYKTIAAAIAAAVTAIVNDSSSYEKDERSASGAAPKRKLFYIHRSPKCFARSFVWHT